MRVTIGPRASQLMERLGAIHRAQQVLRSGVVFQKTNNGEWAQLPYDTYVVSDALNEARAELEQEIARRMLRVERRAARVLKLTKGGAS